MYKAPDLLPPKEFKKYFKERVINWNKKNFYTVIDPLKAFKKVYISAGCIPGIANLIIPVGSLVHVSEYVLDGSRESSRKMRASCAKVDSIVDIETHKKARIAHSEYSYFFEYKPGSVLIPKYNFSLSDMTCESGIHFFLELKDAIEY